jgi:hypothetical protein
MTSAMPPAPGISLRKTLTAETGLVVLAAVAVLLLIVVGIGRPIWQDDANAVLMSRHDFRGLFEALRQDNNLPVYYVLLSLWMRLFGDSEPALRSLSVVFYLAGIGMVFLLGSAIYRSRRMAFYAGLLYLASAQLIHQAQSVRMYTLLGFLSATSLLLFVRIFVQESRSRRFASVYVIVNSVGMLTQVWFFFMLFGQFLCLVLWLRRGLKKFITFTALSGVAFFALWGSAFLNQLHNGSTSWIPPFHPIFLLDILIEFYGNQSMGLFFLLACAAPLVLAAGPVRRAFWREDAARIVLTTLLACILVPLAVSIVKPIYSPARYSTVGLPVLALLLGAILTRLAPRPYAVAICYGILIASMAWHIRDRNIVGNGSLPPGQSDRTTAEYILQHAAPGDCIVFTNLTRAAADYYFRRAGAAERFVETSFPEGLDRHAGWLDRAAMLRHPDALAAEAGRTAERLTAAARTGKLIWLYDGLPGVSEFLKSNLDANLALAERHDLRGPFHGRLLVYTARPETGARADARIR